MAPLIQFSLFTDYQHEIPKASESLCSERIIANLHHDRFTDFQVNEIAENGSVVHLTAVSYIEEPQPQPKGDGAQKSERIVPQEEAKPKEDQQQEEAPTEPSVQVSPEDAAILTSLAGAHFAPGCIDLLSSARTQPRGAKPPAKRSVVSEPTDDRDKRTKIHQEVRRIFDSRIETRTDDSGAIVASIVDNRRGKKRNRRQPQQALAPGGDGQPRTGEYLHFTLYKENRDTMDAVNQVARMLRVKPQNIGYAGTKDRRAATAQRCSIRHIRDRALTGLNSKLRGIYIGEYEYKENSIHLGQLLGNEFVITIKNCRLATESANSTTIDEKAKALDANIRPALNHLYEHGWINYFGHQRFGTHEIRTHDIGKLLLCDKFEEAMKALLSYDPDIAAKAEAGELPQETHQRDDFLRHQACMLYLTGKDYTQAEALMPRRFAAETCIIRHLNRAGDQSRRDFVGGIVHITRGLRSMYLHAYQSHVWNHAASMRWELHGSTVVKGDLIVDDTDPASQANGGQDQDGDDIINPIDSDEDRPVRARPLTEEEASSGRYTIHHVVLPSPGYEVIYPDNEVGTFYTEFMAREENGGLDPQKMRRIRREFSVPGRYRKLMNKFLGQPSIEVKAYSDDLEQMHPTDLDLIKQAKQENDDNNESARKRVKTETTDPNTDEQDTPKQDPVGTSGEEKKPEDPQKLSVIVKFQLGSSAYATVALRELMGDVPEGT